MKKPGNTLFIAMLCSMLVCAVFVGASAQAQSPTGAVNDNRSEAGSALAPVPRLRFALTPSGFRLTPATITRTVGSPHGAIIALPLVAGSNLPVLGGGTPGRLTKWTGFNSSNSSIGDSTIFETKTGLVGIGTGTPTSQLTVAGMIETTLGGYTFPDGTVQTTSAAGSLFEVSHNITLSGNGTGQAPLGLAVPLNFIGDVSLDFMNPRGLINIENSAQSGHAMFARGGAGILSTGGTGLLGRGGAGGATSFGGAGIFGLGGQATNGTGGAGVSGVGGQSTGGNGGDGLVAFAGRGTGTGKKGGSGIVAVPGDGVGGATKGLAGEFRGDVTVLGTLSKAAGSFSIDHPLDPANKYLSHSFVESPDMMNVYNGNITTDQGGEATVTLPDYFEALNRDFRYQLTVIGQFAQAIVARKVSGNSFTIKTDSPGVEVSWQVTGIRQDAYANKHRIPVEQEKPGNERGYYLHPIAFDLPEEKSVEWARNPEMMRQMKEMLEKQMEELKQKTRANDR